MTIALIDDDKAVLDSLRMLLASHQLATRCFPSAAAFLDANAGTRFSCIVSDVRMPQMTGLELQRELKSQGSIIPMIFITGYADVPMAVRALKDGAHDFIEKPFDDNRLVESIRSAATSGDRLASRQAAVAEFSARFAELTERQRQVMELVVQGLSNKEIARSLGISPRTVENYRAWVMEKMAAENLADLVRMTMMQQVSEP